MAHGDAPQGRRNDGAFHRFVRKPKAPIVHSTKDNLQVLFEDNHIVAVNKRSFRVAPLFLLFRLLLFVRPLARLLRRRQRRLLLLPRG